MKRLFVAGLFLSLFSSGGHALCFPERQFALKGELLYFHPSIEQDYFVIDGLSANDSIPLGKRENNDPDFHCGYRLEGIYTCGVENVKLRFTHFIGSHQKTVSGDFLYKTQDVPGFFIVSSPFSGSASSNLDFRYYGGDLTYGHMILDCCPFDLTLFSGLQYSYVKNAEKVIYSGAAGTEIFRTRTHFSGIGPELGVALHYLLPFSCLTGLAIAGESRGALLVGRTDSTFRYDISGSDFAQRVNNESNWRVVPAFDFRLGLDYEILCDCFDFYLEVGYEFIWQHSSINRVDFPSITGVSPGHSIDLYSNLSLHGPYLTLGISF